MAYSFEDGFRERERLFETKYCHDEDLTFRVNAKRNHLFGLWAASLLGYTQEKEDLYVDAIIVVDLQKTHEEDVLHKVLRDFEEAKVQISEHRVRKKLAECEDLAKKIIMNEEGV